VIDAIILGIRILTFLVLGMALVVAYVMWREKRRR